MGLAAYGKEGVNLSDLIKIRNAESRYNVDIENMCRHVAPTIYEAHYSDALVEHVGDNRDGCPADQSKNGIATSPIAVQSSIGSLCDPTC